MNENREKLLAIIVSSVFIWASGCGNPQKRTGGSTSKGDQSLIEGIQVRGLASWYGKRFHGRKTASGEHFDMHSLTAAHRTLPFGTRVKVSHLDTGKSVIVRINDRGPFGKNRIIDLSRKAAAELGILNQGLASVKIQVLKD